MRIGIDALFENPAISTGAGIYLQVLVKTLTQIDQDNEYVVFGSKRNRHWFPEDSRNFRFVTYPYTNENIIARILEQQVVIPIHSKRLGIDVLFAAGNQTSAFGHVPAVVKIHDAGFVYLRETMDAAHAGLRSWYRRAMTTLSSRKGVRLITNSHTYRDAFCQLAGCSPAKFTIVPDPVDIDFFSPTRNSGSTDRIRELGLPEPFLLYVSALWNAKRPEAAIETLARLRTKYRLPHHLVIAGGESGSPVPRTAVLRQLATDLGISEAVHFLGHVQDRELLRELYWNAEVFLFPSVSETFGIPPVEALAAGCPVVAANRTAVPEIVGEIATIVDPDDLESMSDAVYAYLKDETARESLASRLPAFLDRFRPEVVARQTLDILTSVGRVSSSARRLELMKQRDAKRRPISSSRENH